MMPIFSLIVPVYNEEEVIMHSYKRLKSAMEGLGEPYEIIFVNDGSRDKSREMLLDLCKEDETLKLIDFSRNFGHQPAISAGMELALGQAVIVIDADLQDPPETIPLFVEKWREGFDVVYGKRKSRKGETFFKKFTAKAFYRILKFMSGMDMPTDTGDFRLMDRKVLEAVNSLDEKHRYVRGLVSWVGFKQVGVLYDRDERFAGETKYPLKKMLSFAKDGILSFSLMPLRLATSGGMIMAALSFIYLVFVFIERLFFGTTVSGWASLIGVLLLTQGIVLMILGIIGEYIGRIYDESKNRPNYIVNEVFTKESFDEKGE